ncbi:MAG: hypothetical protein N4A46_16050 [Schleiferiaceae bacterium]|jgi:hypothetical protein|nr:hypothetical protein [Schleiferiaceae bacterium]
MDVEILIPFAGMALTFGVFYFFITSRHKERMKLIESGADPSLFYNSAGKRNSAIKFGMLLIGVGVGVFMGNLLESVTPLDEDVTYPSMIMIFAGLGLLAGNKIAMDMENKEKEQ